ncbi:MAG: hypothetical protein AB2687_00540 [Candidatus Thiodiazotropha taylori]
MKSIKSHPLVEQSINNARESLGDRAPILKRNWAGMDENRRAHYVRKAGCILKTWSDYSGREQEKILKEIKRADSVTASDAQIMGVRS